MLKIWAAFIYVVTAVVFTAIGLLIGIMLMVFCTFSTPYSAVAGARDYFRAKQQQEKYNDTGRTERDT